MEIIDVNDIKFDKLKFLNTRGSQSMMYTDGVNLYKMFEGLFPSEKVDAYNKFLDLDGRGIRHIILPNKLIIKNGLLCGYIMPYYKDYFSLGDLFRNDTIDLSNVLISMYYVSHVLRYLHDNGIIIKDFSFQNILINQENDILFCDMESCLYHNNCGPFVSDTYQEFMDKYKPKIAGKDMDNLSLLLELYRFLCSCNFDIKNKRNNLINNISTLKNINDYLFKLINSNERIDVPYLDELIDFNDTYVIDKDRDLPFFTRILKKIVGD